MFCPNCGKELKEGARFCTECGVELASFLDVAKELAPSPSQDPSPDSEAAGSQDNQTETPEGEADASKNAKGSGAKKAGVAALLASSVQLAGVAVPAFALVTAGAIAVGAAAYAVVSATGNTQHDVAQVSQEESPTEKTNREAHEAFDGVVNAYKDVVHSDNPGELIQQGMRTRQQDSPVAFFTMFDFFNPIDERTASELAQMRYAYVDLNNDGIDELVIIKSATDFRFAPVIFDAFSFKDGKATRLFITAARDYRCLCANNILCEYGNSGAYFDIWTYGTLEEDGSFKELESFETDRDDRLGLVKGTHKIGGSIVETTEDPDANDGSSATNLNRVLNELKQKYPAPDDINWQAF